MKLAKYRKVTDIFVEAANMVNVEMDIVILTLIRPTWSSSTKRTPPGSSHSMMNQLLFK